MDLNATGPLSPRLAGSGSGRSSRSEAGQDRAHAGARFDVSLVANFHAESKYLRRTMLSLAEAVTFARGFGICVEVVVVLDRSPPQVARWFAEHDFSAFDAHTIMAVDNGSLGCSRNDGMGAARGEYIAFCDEDDLVSYNYISELFLLAKSCDPLTILIPQYFLMFDGGHDPKIYEFFGSDRVSPLALIRYHPYQSRVFFNRSLVGRLSFEDISVGSGYAYEDWHFNANALALGCSFSVAPNTMVFYRLRRWGNFKKMEALSSGQIPPSPFFAPERYLALCSDAYDAVPDPDERTTDPEAVKANFLLNDICLEMLNAANAIDPGINVAPPERLQAMSNDTGDLRLGGAYYQACRRVGVQSFTDVVLLPFLTASGAEKYILNVLSGIAELQPESRFLFLCGEAAVAHNWLDRLPVSSVFLDLKNLCSGLREEEIDIITLKLLQASAPTARLHIKGCIYAHRFLERFGRVLAAHRKIYYRFSDGWARMNSDTFLLGFQFSFLAEQIEIFDLVLTDNERIAASDRHRIGIQPEKWFPLYARCDIPSRAAAKHDLAEESPMRLLWASRLDPEKRPELLLRIAEKLAAKMPSALIDVYGKAVLGDFDPACFKACTNVLYRGTYASFDQLPHEHYGALIYTTAFDGLPNIILEALSVGLPVVAPDVGGVGDAVLDGRTGYLLENTIDDEALADAYVEAVGRISGRAELRAEMQRNALELMSARHSAGAFSGSLSKMLEKLTHVS